MWASVGGKPRERTPRAYGRLASTTPVWARVKGLNEPAKAPTRAACRGGDASTSDVTGAGCGAPSMRSLTARSSARSPRAARAASNRRCHSGVAYAGDVSMRASFDGGGAQRLGGCQSRWGGVLLEGEVWDL